MDWHATYNQEYDGHVARLSKDKSFQPREATFFQVAPQSQAGPQSQPTVMRKNIQDESEMQVWLDGQRLISQQSASWPDWSLKVLALSRDKNSKFDLGITQQHFRDLSDVFGLPKSFAKCIRSDQSFYAGHHVQTRHGVSESSFDIKTSPVGLGNIGLSSISRTSTASTFVLITGCLKEDIKEIGSWLEVMKEYAGHPMLMVALFFELHHRSVNARYRQLREEYTLKYYDSFGAVVDVHDYDAQPYRDKIESVNILNEDLQALDMELSAIKLRVPGVMESLELITKKCPPGKQSRYLHDYGKLLTDHLKQLSGEVEYLQTKVSTASSSASMLISSVCSRCLRCLCVRILTLSSMWNIANNNESQLAKEISTASWKDSAIMVGIAVGTLTFLSGTAIATIFAMPLFNWQAASAHQVTQQRFWIHLVITFPLTAVTLAVLFWWMYITGSAPTTDTNASTILKGHFKRTLRLPWGKGPTTP